MTLRRFFQPIGIGSILTRTAIRYYGFRREVRVNFQDGTPKRITFTKDSRRIIVARNHWQFSADMVNLFDTYFRVVRPEPIGKLMVVDYSVPKVQTYTKSGLSLHFSFIPEDESANEDSFGWYTPRAGETVFDIGANVGALTYALSNKVGPAGRVYAFEPDPLNYSLLLKNIEEKGLANVTAVNLAIAGSTGRLDFNSEATIGSGLTSTSARPSAGTVVPVEATTLAGACLRVGCIPSYVAMDIEGAEIEALQAAVPFLKENRIQLAIDTRHRVGKTFTSERVEAILRSAGYRAETGTDGFTTTTWGAPLSSAQ